MAGFSLARKTGASRSEYQGYLASPAWKKRRRVYFETVRLSGFEPACQCCFTTLTEAKALDLHHLSYEGVTKDASGRWLSAEDEADLVPLCRDCHERLHTRLDARRMDYWGWDRRRATAVVLTYLRRELERESK